MYIQSLPQPYRDIAIEYATTFESEDDLTDAQLLEILLRSEGIFGFARVIISFIDAIRGEKE